MSPQQFQSAFFAELADPQALRGIFDHLPDVYFFVKDRQSRIVAASVTILERLGLRSEAEFIGTSDAQFFPPEVAAGYQADDRDIFKTGKPIIDRVEVWFDAHRNLEWCLTTKVPLRGRNGKIIGLMGVTRRDNRQLIHEPARDGARALAFLRRNIARAVSPAELARECGTSERTLHRKLKQAFGVTPYELSLRVRVQEAGEAILRTRTSIAEIAAAHGFCDQSSFTQHFRRRMGMTPKQFRQRYVSA